MNSVNSLYSGLGVTYKITSKSSKALGVSQCVKLALPNDYIRILGRWKSIHTAQNYRDCDESTLLKIHSNLPKNIFKTCNTDSSSRQSSVLPSNQSAVQCRSLDVQKRSYELTVLKLDYLESIHWELVRKLKLQAVQLAEAKRFISILQTQLLSAHNHLFSRKPVPQIQGNIIRFPSNHSAVQFLIGSGYCYPNGVPVHTDGFPVAREVPVVNHPDEIDLALEDFSTTTINLP